MAIGSESTFINNMTIGPDSQRAAWEAEEPIHRSVYISLDTGRVHVWDADNGVSDSYVFGGTNYVANITAPGSGRTMVVTELIGAVVTTVDRAGVGIKLVEGSPANTEVSFDSSTGTFTLGPDDAFYGEWIRVGYSNIPEATIGV